MWRVLVVVVLLVLAGCATEAPNSATDNDSEDQRALTTEEMPNRSNPWGNEELVVALNNTANESRNFRPLVNESLNFWANNSTRYAGFPVEYRFEPNASNPDLVVEFVDDIESCANVSDPAGCAPYVTHSEAVSRPVSIEVVGSYSNESTRLILKHELGHTLGLNHSAGPRSVMAPSSQLKTLPRPNATERHLPWDDANFTVYLGIDNVSNTEAVREQVRHALDYYAEGANGTVPANASFELVDNETDADVVVKFGEDLPCRAGDSGSCGRVHGNDPDGDGALERYNRLRVTLSNLDTEVVGWHVAYWLGYGFGFEEDSEWPEPLRDASYEDRRGEWWETEE
jgi:hypothetical protein